ncbi:hypothetical protein JTB14_027030 [Gonioctena quinquepunctata]|nr:hypothetical protein JTB14_027030 [Gonioctena quinquepunctata]
MVLSHGSNQPNKHLQNSIENIIREELKLSVGYIVEQISLTATKVDVLKDSNIDLVSLLTNKQSLFRSIPHSYPIQPNIPSPNQQTICDAERVLTNDKNIAAEMEIRPTQFFRKNYNPKIHSLSNHEDNSKDFSTCKYQARRQPEEHNFHPRQNKKFYDNKSRQYYLPQLYRKEQPSSSYNARTYNSGHHRTYNRAPTRTYRQPGPHYTTRIFQNSKYNYNVSVNYNPHI